MQIKSRHNDSPFRIDLEQRQVRWRRVAGALGLVALMVLGAYLVALAMLRSGERGPRSPVTVAEQLRARITSRPKRLVLDIKQKHMQRIRYARERALEDAINLPGPDDYVPAELRFEGDTLEARIRLKGVYAPNWGDSRKWSLLLKIKGEKTLLGMKRCAIQHPANGDFIFEWLFDKALEDEGMLAQRYRFVEVVINGDEYGIYAFHEHFGKRLVEHGRRRAGPIIGFNKDLLLEEYRRGNRQGVQPYNVDGAFWSAFIDGVQTGGIEPGSSEEELYLKAQSLLEAFRLGLLPAADVFDLETMATGLAMKALFGAYEFDWKDLKLYYNPILGRLEPIVAEVHHRPVLAVPGWWLNDGNRPYMESFTRKLFADEAFFEEYIRALDRLSRPEYLQQLISRHAKGLEENLNILHRDYPRYEFSPKTLIQIQKQIRALLEPLRGLHAYYSQAADGQVVLELGSMQHFPLEILRVTTADGESLSISERTILPGKRALDPVSYRAAVFDLPQSSRWTESSSRGMTLFFRLLGTEREFEVEVFPWPHLRQDLVFGDPIRTKKDLHGYPFLVVDDEAKKIRFLPGRWEIRETLILPAGYRVEGGPNLQLNLHDGASIVSHSSLSFVGQEDSPVLIESLDGSGGGLAVIRAEGQSLFDHVIMRNLSAPSEGGWELSGAVTFYESDVTFLRSTFAKNLAGDDLVNLVRSEFRIEDCQFLDGLADALDADFSKGVLLRTRFEKTGNDAIDTSGSQVRLRKVSIEGAGDKALSFGEGSVIEGVLLKISGVRVAVASKDLSVVRLRRLQIVGASIGLAAYAKKPEFGPGSLWLEQLQAKQVSQPYLLEEGSLISVDRRRLEVNSEDTARVLESGI